MFKEKIDDKIKRYQSKQHLRLRKEFLPEALEIVEKPTSPLGSFAIIITTLIIIFFLLWSILGKVDEVATARGKVSTVNGIQLIQPLKGGMITDICVKEGDKVTAGQSIILLDSSTEEITLKNTEESLELLQFKNQLLNEVMENKDISVYLETEKNENRIKIIDYIDSLNSNFQTQKAQTESTIQQNLEQITIEQENLNKIKDNKQILEDKKSNILGLMNYTGPENLTIDKMKQLIAEKEKQLKDYTELYKADAISKAELEKITQELEQLKKDYDIQAVKGVYENNDFKTQITDVEAQLKLLEIDYTNQQTNVKVAQQKYEQSKDALANLDAQFKANISNLIVENNDAIKTQQANLQIQTIDFNTQKLISPVNGTVKTLEVKTIGGIIPAAQTAATIVPDNSQLIVEADVLNKDAGFIKVGQNVSIKLDTFNFQKYGMINGTITFISADAIFDERKGWVYKAKIALDTKDFNQKSPNLNITAGMECTAEIKISERRIIEFFLEPLIKHFDESLKVR